VLILLNLLFLLYWLLRLKRELLLSLIILAVGYNHLMSFYKFRTARPNAADKGIDLMSFNVRQFNRFHWIKNDSIPDKIKNYIQSAGPAVLCFQEYYSKNAIRLPNYPH